MSIKAVIVEDDSIHQELLNNLLSSHFSYIDVVGIAYDVIDGYETIQAVQPDLVFLDVQLWSGNCFDLLYKLKSIDFDIIFTSSYTQFAIEAFRIHAADYLMKPISLHDLEAAISRVELRRSAHLTPKDSFGQQPSSKKTLAPLKDLIFSKVHLASKQHKLNRIERQETFKSDHKKYFDQLTPRELEITRLLMHGHNNREMADLLFVSRHTVEQHRKNINKKLGVHSITQLFEYALAFDLV